MKTIALILGTVLVLGGCATKLPQVQVPKEVKVLVATACKTQEPPPADLRYSPPYNSVFEAVRDLLGDNEVRDAYENELRIALRSCK